MAGVAAAVDPRVADLDEDALRDLLVDTGRRVLGLRAPNRKSGVVGDQRGQGRCGGSDLSDGQMNGVQRAQAGLTRPSTFDVP